MIFSLESVAVAWAILENISGLESKKISNDQELIQSDPIEPSFEMIDSRC